MGFNKEAAIEKYCSDNADAHGVVYEVTLSADVEVAMKCTDQVKVAADPGYTGTMTTTPEQFVSAGIARLPAIPDPHDLAAVRCGLRGMCLEGFTLEDAVAFSRCLQEVDPTLDEAEALARMAAIRSRYAK